VALESGIMAFFVVDVLRELGLAPVVIDAAEVRAKVSRPRQKSDRRDALELVEGLRRDLYRNIVWVPPVSIRLAREVISRRRHFVRVRTMQVNAAKRLLRGWGKGTHVRSLQVMLGWEKLLAALEHESLLAGFVRSHYNLWLEAQKQIQLFDQQLKTLTEPYAPLLSRLQTVPGVGRVVAATFLAVVGEAGRFTEAKQVASYAGIVPSTFQSGTTDRHGHISRRGSPELRSMLCEASQHAQRVNSPLNPFFTKIRARRGYRMAITAVAHRLCRMLYAIMRDGTTFDLAKAGVEEGRFCKVSARRYRPLATAN
jgi:transposase